jgi:hypothetical protein
MTRCREPLTRQSTSAHLLRLSPNVRRLPDRHRNAQKIKTVSIYHYLHIFAAGCDKMYPHIQLSKSFILSPADKNTSKNVFARNASEPFKYTELFGFVKGLGGKKIRFFNLFFTVAISIIHHDPAK